jgi:ParB family chromosome partitioning protein
MDFKIVPIEQIQANPFQPRHQFDDESLAELAESLKSVGEIQPVIVSRFEKGYQIIAGERRWRAAKLAGLKEIPVLIRDTVGINVLLESLIENLHRKELESAERENAISTLWKTGNWKTYLELGNALGKSEDWVRTNIDAASIRQKEKIPSEVATRTIVSTSTLESEDRKRIIEKVRSEEIPEREVRDYVRIVKKAPESIKRELLKTKSFVTPKMAETIVETIPNEEEQSLVLREIKRQRLTEDEVEDRVREIQHAKEMGRPITKEMIVQEGTTYTVGEYECPHCKKHYLIKCDGKRDWVE